MADHGREEEISELKARLDNLSRRPLLNPRSNKKRHTIPLVIGGLLTIVVVGSALDRRGATGAANEATNTLADDPGRERPSSDPSPAAQAAFARINTAFLKAVRPCDEAQSGMARAVRSEDRYGTFNAAQRVKNNCSSSADEIAALSFPPPISASAATSLVASMKKCADDYTARYSAADVMAKTFNGDMRPSDIADARQQNGIAQLAIQECITGYVVAAEAAGFSIPRRSDKGRHRNA